MTHDPSVQTGNEVTESVTSGTAPTPAHDPLCKGGDCTCTCDQLQEGHRRGCPGEDCDCLFIAEIRADERKQAEARVETLRNHPGLITISAAAALAAGDTWTSQL